MSNNIALWIDDDAQSLWDMVNPLIKEGWQIDYALNFQEAVEKIESTKKYDLIILDIIIPSGTSKYKSIEQLAKIDNIQYGLKLLTIMADKLKVPVIVFTVVSDPIVLDQIRDFEIVKDIITKGQIRPSELKEKIFEIIQ